MVSAITATYWTDVDAVWQRAVSEGAEVVHPLADQFYGERAGRVRDSVWSAVDAQPTHQDLAPRRDEALGSFLQVAEGSVQRRGVVVSMRPASRRSFTYLRSAQSSILLRALGERTGWAGPACQ
jgi:hypothetical protein